MKEDKKESILESIKIVAPGTALREGLENILKAKTGGLIVIGDSPEVMAIVDGGFAINSDFSPAYIYELAKMDGAILLSKDCKKILYANTQLVPDSSISSSETGIRHRTAERVAIQTSELVISISQRRNIITIYKGYQKHILKDIGVVLTKANQAIQTLERYKTSLDQSMTNLSALEFEDTVTLYDVSIVIQRTEMVMRIFNEIEKYIIELGNEGRLVSMQVSELIENVKENAILVLKDYTGYQEEKNNKDTLKQLRGLSSEDLLDLGIIAKSLGYSGGAAALENPVSSKGYRILNKIPRLPMVVVENLVMTFKDFQRVLRASIEELDDVDGIGEVRARSISEGLRRVQEQVFLERHL
jgi:diadenylate cyclase